MKKAIFWDFDGTLVKKNHSFLESLQRAALDLGLSFSREDLQLFLSESCSWNHPEITYISGTGELWWESLLGKLQKFSTEHKIPVEKIPLLCRKFRFYAMSYAYQPYGEGTEVLKACRTLGYENYILSNNFPELTETLKTLGFSPYIEKVFLSSCLGAEKPNPLIFSLAREKAGNPETAVMVGDNPEADILGGSRAGFFTIAVHGSCPFADRSAETLRDIPPLLRDL